MSRRNSRAVRLVAAGCAALLVAAGCWSGAESDAVADPADRRLAERVRDELREQPVTRNVAVRVENGRVTLSGQVPSAEDLERIELLVSKIDGVREVDNDLGASGAIARDVTTPPVETTPSTD